jgi:hypothetical protein
MFVLFHAGPSKEASLFFSRPSWASPDKRIFGDRQGKLTHATETGNRTTRGERSKHVLEIGSKASTDTTLLCRGVDADENEVRLSDGAVYVRGESQVTTTCLFDDIDEARFVDGQGVVGAVPCVDSLLVEVNDGNLDVGAFQRNDSASRATL